MPAISEAASAEQGVLEHAAGDAATQPVAIDGEADKQHDRDRVGWIALQPGSGGITQDHPA
jgi:hypothetical protein